jgi:hypothetical protein
VHRSLSFDPLAKRGALARLSYHLLWIGLFSLIAYYVLFRVPFWFPPQQRLWSGSYAFGFNNSIAIFGTAGLVGILTLAYFFGRRREPPASPIVFASDYGLSGRRGLAAAFALLFLFYAGFTLVMYFYYMRSAPSLMWEARHLLHRTRVVEVYGLRPYTDVAAEYGPILTYAPLYTYWFLKPVGASLEEAYFASHLLLNLAGLWCAYYVLSRALMPARARLVAFSILAVAGFGLWMGVSGTLVRYLFPFASVLMGHRAVIWALSGRGRTVCWAGAAAAILMLLFGNILLSSDAGLAFAIAWLGYAVLMIRWDIRVLMLSLIALITAVLLCWLVLPAAYYETLLRFSQGAVNWPLLPAPHLVLYILTLFIIVPPLLAASLWRRSISDLPAASICSAFGLLCVATSPGALGRCDPPHVLFFGMGASMLLMIRLANVSRRAFATYVIAYAGVFIVLMQVINLQVFYRVSPATLLSTHAATHVVDKLRTTTGTAHLDPAKLSALDRYPRLGLPFASFGDPAVERYIVSRHQLEPEYYVAIIGLYDAAAIERKLRDVGKTEYVLVPSSFNSRPSLADPCDGYLKNLREWFLYPAKLPCRAKPLNPMATLRSFIADHYVTVEQVGGWSVLHRINGEPGQDDK